MNVKFKMDQRKNVGSMILITVEIHNLQQGNAN